MVLTRATTAPGRRLGMLLAAATLGRGAALQAWRARDEGGGFGEHPAAQTDGEEALLLLAENMQELDRRDVPPSAAGSGRAEDASGDSLAGAGTARPQPSEDTIIFRLEGELREMKGRLAVAEEMLKDHESRLLQRHVEDATAVDQQSAAASRPDDIAVTKMLEEATARIDSEESDELEKTADEDEEDEDNHPKDDPGLDGKAAPAKEVVEDQDEDSHEDKATGKKGSNSPKKTKAEKVASLWFEGRYSLAVVGGAAVLSCLICACGIYCFRGMFGRRR